MNPTLMSENSVNYCEEDAYLRDDHEPYADAGDNVMLRAWRLQLKFMHAHASGQASKRA